MRVAYTGRLRGRLTRRLLPLAWLVALASSAALAGPAPVRRGAAAFSDYRARVHRAVGLVEELAATYAGENEDSAEELAGKIEAVLPAKEQVEWDGGPVEVDNSWLQEALEEAEAQEDERKAAASLRAAASRLRALEERLKELEESASAGLDRDAERGRLNSILRRPEFARQEAKQRSALERMIEEFGEWLREVFGKLFGGVRVTPGGGVGISWVTVVLVGGLCLLVLAYVVRRLWLRRGAGGKSLRPKRGARVVLGEHLEADQTASALLDEAERLARGGELRAAIRKAYVALLCELGDRGVLRLAQHKTNRDYLDAVRRASRPSLYAEMLPLTSDFELHWYGLRAATDADWQSFRTRCREVLDSRQ